MTGGKDRSRDSQSLLHSARFRWEKINAAIDAIEAKIFNTEETEVSSSRIGEIVMEELKDLDEVAYVRFASV